MLILTLKKDFFLTNFIKAIFKKVIFHRSEVLENIAYKMEITQRKKMHNFQYIIRINVLKK